MYGLAGSRGFLNISLAPCAVMTTRFLTSTDPSLIGVKTIGVAAIAIPATLTELLDAAGLEPDSFEGPLHLGPGMPPHALWARSARVSRADVAGGADVAGMNDTAIA